MAETAEGSGEPRLFAAFEKYEDFVTVQDQLLRACDEETENVELQSAHLSKLCLIVSHDQWLAELCLIFLRS